MPDEKSTITISSRYEEHLEAGIAFLILEYQARDGMFLLLGADSETLPGAHEFQVAVSERSMINEGSWEGTKYVDYIDGNSFSNEPDAVAAFNEGLSEIFRPYAEELRMMTAHLFLLAQEMNGFVLDDDADAYEDDDDIEPVDEEDVTSLKMDWNVFDVFGSQRPNHNKE